MPDSQCFPLNCLIYTLCDIYLVIHFKIHYFQLRWLAQCNSIKSCEGNIEFFFLIVNPSTGLTIPLWILHIRFNFKVHFQFIISSNMVEISTPLDQTPSLPPKNPFFDTSENEQWAHCISNSNTIPWAGKYQVLYCKSS